MKNIFLLVCSLTVFFGCKKNDNSDSTFQNVEIKIIASFSPADVNFVGVANAIVLMGASTTSGYTEILINGQNKGSQATFDEQNSNDGLFSITPVERVGSMTLVINAQNEGTVSIKSEIGGKKEEKTYTLEPGKMLQLQFK